VAEVAVEHRQQFAEVEVEAVVVEELQILPKEREGAGAEAYLITEVAEAVVERIRLIADQ
jgi:hypothetical protein